MLTTSGSTTKVQLLPISFEAFELARPLLKSVGELIKT